jgi:hypothetical protein
MARATTSSRSSRSSRASFHRWPARLRPRVLREVRTLRFIDGPCDDVLAFFAAFAASLHPRPPASASPAASAASLHPRPPRVRLRRPPRLRFIHDRRDCVSAAFAASLHPRPPRLRLRGLRGFASSMKSASHSSRASRPSRRSLHRRSPRLARFASTMISAGCFAAPSHARFDDDLRGLLRRAFARSLRR